MLARQNQNSSGIFPKDKSKSTEKPRFGYKTRGQPHPVRKVNIKKDTKDVTFKKPMKQEGSTTASSSNTTIASTKSNGTVTLSEDQFTKILSLLTTNERGAVVESQTVVTEPREETPPDLPRKVPENPVAPVTQNSVKPMWSIENTEKLNAMDHMVPSEKVDLKNQAAKHTSGKHYEHLSMQSAFQVGGDGSPNLNSIDQRKKDQKRQWLEDLNKQREEQASKKRLETDHRKSVRQINHWSARPEVAQKVVTAQKTDYNNTPQSNWSTPRSEPAIRPHNKQVEQFQSNGGTGYQWTDPADVKRQAYIMKERQQDALRAQIDEKNRLKEEVKKREKEQLDRENQRIHLEQDLLRNRYLVESGKTQPPQGYEPSIARAVEKALSPRNHETQPYTQPEPVRQSYEPAQATQRSLEAVPASIPPPSQVQSTSYSVRVQKVHPGKNKLQVELTPEMLSTLTRGDAGRMFLDLDFTEMPGHKTTLKSDDIERRGSEGNVPQHRVVQTSQGNQTTQLPRNSVNQTTSTTMLERKMKTEPSTERTHRVKAQKKWGQSDKKTIFVPASERMTDVNGRARRAQRLKERQEKLLRDQDRNASRVQTITQRGVVQRKEKTGRISAPPLPIESSDQEYIPFRRTQDVLEPNRPLTTNSPAKDKFALEQDVLKNRDRQQKILQEISTLRQGLLQKRQDLYLD